MMTFQTFHYTNHKDLQERFSKLLPTGSGETEVFRVGIIPVAILPTCQDIKTIALQRNAEKLI